MRQTLYNNHLDTNAFGNQRPHRRFHRFERNHLIRNAVDDQQGNLPVDVGGILLRPRRNGNRGPKEFRVSRRHIPGAPPAHAETRHKRPGFVNRVVGLDCPDQIQHILLALRVVPTPRHGVGRNDDRPKILQRRQDQNLQHPAAVKWRHRSAEVQ